MEDMGSAVKCMSPMFYSNDDAILEAVRAWMSCAGSAVAWSLFDDCGMSPPEWPTMERKSPWRPSLSVCRVREWTNLTFGALKGGMEPPSFSQVNEAMIHIVNRVAKEEGEWSQGQG